MINILNAQTNMVDHGLFTNWENLCHNLTFDHDLFSYWDNLCHHATLNHGKPWSTMVGHGLFSNWDNLSHNVNFNHGWPWLIMVDDGWWSLTMVNFHIETIFVIIWMTMVKHDYKPKGFILNPMNNIIP